MIILLVDTEDFAKHFLVVEVMLHALDLLVVFMSLSGNEDHIALLSIKKAFSSLTGKGFVN